MKKVKNLLNGNWLNLNDMAEKLDEICPVAKDQPYCHEANLKDIPGGFFIYLKGKGIKPIDFWCLDENRKTKMLQKYINEYGNV